MSNLIKSIKEVLLSEAVVNDLVNISNADTCEWAEAIDVPAKLVQGSNSWQAVVFAECVVFLPGSRC